MQNKGSRQLKIMDVLYSEVLGDCEEILNGPHILLLYY